MTELDLKLQELNRAFEDLKEENKRIKFSNALLEKELKEYRELDEQGLLLKLPCKVGDKVWHEKQNATHLIGVHTYEITNVMISQNKKGEWTRKYRAMRLYNGKTIDSQINFSFEEIGKTVFLTKEEAEAKLKELKNE